MSDMTTPIAGRQLREQVAEEVRAWMARRRISGVKLAERIGRAQPYVARRLNGDVSFDLDDLVQIAEVLEVSIGQLLPPDVLQRRPRETGVQTTRESLALASRLPERAERTTVPLPTVADRPQDNRPSGRAARVATAPTARRPALVQSPRRPLAA